MTNNLELNFERDLLRSGFPRDTLRDSHGIRLDVKVADRFVEMSVRIVWKLHDLRRFQIEIVLLEQVPARLLVFQALPGSSLVGARRRFLLALAAGGCFKFRNQNGSFLRRAIELCLDIVLEYYRGIGQRLLDLYS